MEESKGMSDTGNSGEFNIDDSYPGQPKVALEFGGLNSMKFQLHTTQAEKYDPAMKITDRAEADAYFEELVKHCMLFSRTREEAEKIERSNLGYYAGYYDHATRERVELLFNCEHPVFGKIKDNGPPTQREAIMSGMIVSALGVEKARQCFK